MHQIMVNEHHPKRGIGYPYIISFNNENDVIVVDGFKMLDKRTLDCGSEKFCIAITQFLIDNKITNIDLGAFQANYKHHAEKDLSIFFNYDKSYRKACLFMEQLVYENGWNWQTLGNYHSKTEKFNKRYVEKIQNRVYASKE